MKESPYPSLFNKVDCVRIPVPDLYAGLKFYRDQLGLQLIWQTDDSAGLHLANDASEVVLYTEPKGLEIDFEVDDVDEAIERYVTAGGTLVSEPFEIRIGKCVIVKDPWDNQYILIDTSKGLLETDAEKKVITPDV
jgi:lactoylglutathione lyase